MNKKLILFLISTLFTLSLFAAPSSGRIKFLKGNISDKTSAVKEASSKDAVWLTNQAINFCLENIEIIGTDRDLDSLAVAAVYSISQDYVKYASDEEKETLSEQLIDLFTKYTKSPSVQIAVLAKAITLREYLPTENISIALNEYITSVNINTTDAGVFKATVSALEYLGNNDSFVILYSFLYNPKYSKYKPEIEKALITLLPYSMDEMLSLLQQADMVQMNTIFTLITNNSNISKNSLCEISENMLSKSILIIDNSSKVTAEYLTIPTESMSILSENKWTRASSIALSYFQICKQLYHSGVMEENDFNTVITALANIAPIDSITPLITYLEELNNQTERGNSVSENTVLSVIKTLGAIGDKAAFDSLLAVTYLNYPESVLHASQEALLGLRW